MTRPQAVQELFDLITEVVNDDPETWRAKKAYILALAKEDEDTKAAFEEFLSWFEPAEEPTNDRN